jgi:hypothetical protein
MVNFSIPFARPEFLIMLSIFLQLTNTAVNYHPIIGIVVFIALFFQPLLGFIHHAKFKKLGRRQIWSYLHLFNGRIMITLGIINGGLGLYLAGASKGLKTAYAVVAAVMWALCEFLSPRVLFPCFATKAIQPSHLPVFILVFASSALGFNNAQGC